MKLLTEFNRLSAIVLTGLLFTSGVNATLLSINPQGTTGFEVGEVGAQVSFDINVSELSPGDVVSAYDLGLIYDPSVMTLSGFSGFTNLLGGPGDVLNADHLDTSGFPLSNSEWDYRVDSSSPNFGAYVGPVFGVPDITGSGDINEGSLRFSQLSLLNEGELIALQEPAVNDLITLFTLTFDVDTSMSHSTAIRFVDDRDYAGWTGDPGEGLMDMKLNDGSSAVYADRTFSAVSVPAPGTLLLLSAGLFGGLGLRRKISAKQPGRYH